MIRILTGDCREVMATLPEASVDAIVCAPPYELGFMGKRWDATGVANDVNTWRAALRVLKPGGHFLAFSGTRTYHRMVCAIEDAGFEVRDQIGWVYGSGFPKSLDVSKAIDKVDATEARRARSLRFTEWLRGTGISSSRVNELTGTNMGGHYLTAAQQPAVATREHFEMLRAHLSVPVPVWVEQLVDERTVESENFKARQVVGMHSKNSPGNSMRVGMVGADVDPVQPITAAHTDAARQWQGWGTALKPAWEPICVARKPIVGTVAANVLAHGTGALNIDGCRVGEDGGTRLTTTTTRKGQTLYEGGINNGAFGEVVPGLGRWPANIIHDGSDQVLAAFPEQVSGSRAAGVRKGMGFQGADGDGGPAIAGSAGSAARFFYTAKASAHDRNDGTYDMPRVTTDDGREKSIDNPYLRGETKRGNHHPTVKPTDLMRYLCRLVTPPGGTVLDPFMGSGSTLKAAELEGFSAIGIELDPAYIEIARNRIASDAPLFAQILTDEAEAT